MIALLIIAVVIVLRFLEFKLRIYSCFIRLLLKCVYGLIIFLGVIFLACFGFHV